MKIPMSSMPGVSPLVKDYLEHYERVADFYNGDFQAADAYLAQADRVKNRDLPLARLIPLLKKQNQRFGCGQQTLEKIDLLLERRACAVVTGQQTGLFGGPLFTIYKALSAVKLADRLSRTCEGCYIPVFWLASDDHDFREVNHIFLLDKNSEPAKIAYQNENENPRRPVSDILLTSEIANTLEQLRKQTYASDFRDGTLTLLQDAYTPGTPFSEAFARWMTTLFKSFGLIFIDGSAREMKALATGLFEHEIAEFSPSTEAVRKTSAGLQKQGYHNQVQLTEGVLNLFFVDEERKPLHFENSSFYVKSNHRTFSKADLLATLHKTPERFSPNVLLRPLYQDWLLPTVAYVAGPAELAYYAQMKGIYQLFDLPMPIIYPRKSLTLLEPKVEKILDKYRLRVRDFWRPPEELLNQIVRAHLPQDLEQQIEHAQKSIVEQLQELEKEVVRFDATLQGAMKNTTGRLLNQLGGLEKKIRQAYKKRNAILVNHVYKASHSLYPNHHLQERELNIVPFLFKFGLEFVDRLYEAIDIVNFEHQIIDI